MGRYTGTRAGRVSASSKPVTMALQSVTVFFRLVIRSKRYSVSTAVRMDTAMIIAA